MANRNYNKKTSSSRHNKTKLNVEKFKSILSYFSHLQINGEISDEAFEALTSYACLIFIENEVEIVIQETLERKFMQLLTSRFSSEREETDLEAAITSLKLST